jgi:hypothetical protein
MLIILQEDIMATTMEKRLAELALRVANLEQQLATQNRELTMPREGRAEMVTSVKKSNVLGSPTATGDSEDAKIQRAEELFATLLDEMNPPRLISYSEAYRRIVGPYAAWRNAVHAPEVIRLACQTSQRRVGRLTIRLDALIVGMQTRRPAGGHFTNANAAYSEADWIQTFGTWPLMTT